MEKVLLNLFALLLLSIAASGQTNEIKKQTFIDSESGETLMREVHLHRSIELEDDSQMEDIQIDLTGDIIDFMFSITTKISAGRLIIEMYNSKGEKQESIEVGSQLNSKKSEIVNGRISKRLKEPHPGIWKIKIIPSNATGSIRIETIATNRN